MAKNRTLGKAVAGKKLVQSVLLIGGPKKSKCQICDFMYFKSIGKSRDQHESFHNDFLYGDKITSKQVKQKLFSTDNAIELKKLTIDDEKVKISAIVLSCEDKLLVSTVEAILTTANRTWLNSTDSSNNWKIRPQESKVVLLVCERSNQLRVIGVTTTDPPEVDHQYIPGFPMDSQSCEIDESKPPLQLRLGVSRIYVVEKYRGYGLAKFMLDTLLKHAVYGTLLKQTQIGFSQPSGAGLHLMKSWYNGSATVPVYFEH